jgi:phosphoglycerate dehydrogenase-like enzyme
MDDDTAETGEAPRVAMALEPREGAGWLASRSDGGWLAEAIQAGGGELLEPRDARGLIWCDPAAPDELRELLASTPGIEWVQLPFAGVEPYRDVIDDRRVWTCAKRVYGTEVAEHALALLLAGFRGLGAYARERRWGPERGRTLVGADVVIVGGGGIAEELLRLLAPFGCTTTAVRRRAQPVPGADRTVTTGSLPDALSRADAVVLALALTPETEGIIDAAALARMPAGAWLVNVARGRHVVTADLVAALDQGRIGGAALDVTDPEPLPEGHPLWQLDNCLITPHVANTFEMLRPRLAALVTANVARFAAGAPLEGVIDPIARY